ncbi:putative sugar epimerase YhfK [Planctomycetes bacterium Poly30]|uniref:Putative sugar epimerase YhfK n=1 Tax=Saltatorellus ferox TaxID=2528018 RepID=A0A518ELE5_9BACT|nr:putative sugar epimerase YhfK [Planctomycetes bacterium Poly30]
MNISVIGAHGSIARSLTHLLKKQGHEVRGLVRKESQFDDVRSDGAEPVLCDIESVGPEDLDTALAKSDVVVFAAGAGPGSGVERKHSVDRDGAIKSVDSAVRIGADRFLIISSMGADSPPSDDDSFSVYLRAKAAADDAARSAKIASTIIRPGKLTDEEPTGRVRASSSVERGEIPRRDVAAVLADLIDGNKGREQTFELISGTTPIPEALQAS